MDNKFYGKYRARVVNTADPEKRGRLQVNLDVLPAVKDIWALPAMPYAGKGVGMFMLPPKGAMVWLEFEAGNIDVPIWSGCFWEKTEDNPAKSLLKKPEDAEKTLMFKTGGYSFYIKQDGDNKGMQIKVEEPVAKYPFIINIQKNQLKLTTDIKNKNDKEALTISLDFKDKQKILFSTGKKQNITIEKDGIALIHEDSKKATVKLNKQGISLKYGEDGIELKDRASSWKQGGAQVDLKNNKINLNKQGLEVS